MLQSKLCILKFLLQLISETLPQLKAESLKRIPL